MQPQPPGSSPESTRLLGLKSRTQSLRRRRSLHPRGTGLLQSLNPLLDQHFGHIADSSALLFRESCEPMTEFFGQNHLNPGRFRLPAG